MVIREIDRELDHFEIDEAATEELRTEIRAAGRLAHRGRPRVAENYRNGSSRCST